MNDTSNIAIKLGGILFFLASFIAINSVHTIANKEMRISSDFVEINGIVTSLESLVSDGATVYRYHTTFVVDGKEYGTSNRVYSSELLYSKNDSIPLKYNPANPNLNRLQTHIEHKGMLVTGLFAIFLCWMLAFAMLFKSDEMKLLFKKYQG